MHTIHNYTRLLILFVFVTLLQSCSKRTRQEPYTEIEETNITLTYIISDNVMHHQRIGGAILLGENPRMKAYCDVTNTSDHGGVFKFRATLTSQGESVEFKNEKFIKSGDTERLMEEKEINPFSFKTNVRVENWEVIAPIVSERKEVIKYRTVEY